MDGPPEGFYYGIYHQQFSIQIYFELSMDKQNGYDRLLRAKIDSFQSYLRRASLSKRNKELYTNFIKVMNRLYNMRFRRINAPSEKRLESLEDDIADPKNWLVEREWLLEKIRQIKDYWNKRR